MDRDAAACRLVGKVLLVGTVHLGEISHVDNEDLYSTQPQASVSIERKLADCRTDSWTGEHTFTFTTFSIEDPAAAKMAAMFLQHCSVLSATEPSIRFAALSAGIWPETKTWPFALMA